jgi:hypothetical protein
LAIVALLLATGLWSNLGNGSLSETNADANASHKLPDLSAPRTEVGQNNSKMDRRGIER